jgi:dTDP-glucose 4,6-dehydratase
VVRTVLQLLGKPESLIRFVQDRPGHDWRYSMGAGKIRRQTGWRAETSFEEGIEKTVRWYLANKEWLFEKVKRLRSYWAKVYK